MITSPLVQTDDDCTEDYCRILRAADVLSYYASGTSMSPWYITPSHHVMSAEGLIHSPQNADVTSASQAILNADYIAFAQPELIFALSQVLLERAETHKLNECYYCRTKLTDCPSILISDLILSLPYKMQDLPNNLPNPGPNELTHEKE